MGNRKGIAGITSDCDVRSLGDTYYSVTLGVAHKSVTLRHVDFYQAKHNTLKRVNPNQLASFHVTQHKTKGNTLMCHPLYLATLKMTGLTRELNKPVTLGHMT